MSVEPETEAHSTMPGTNSNSSLAQAMQADSAGVLYDLEPDSKRLIVAFGGLAGRMGMPPSEFFRTLSAGVKVKTVFGWGSGSAMRMNVPNPRSSAKCVSTSAPSRHPSLLPRQGRRP